MEEKNNAVEKVENIEKSKKELDREDRQRKKIQRRKIKEYKRDEKEKARLAYRRERSKMLLDKENRKQELQAERIARLDELRKQKELARQNRKSKRQENRQINKRRHNGIGGWVTAVISLGVCSLLLATALTLVFIMPSSTEKDMESLYQKSFYDTATEIDNIDANFPDTVKHGIIIVREGVLDGYPDDATVEAILNAFSSTRGGWVGYEDNSGQVFVYYKGTRDGVPFAFEFQTFRDETFKLTGASKDGKKEKAYSKFFQEALDNYGL